MGKRKRKSCIYCLYKEGSTKDHLFPRRWYPSSTSSKIQRITVPACRECNQKYAKIEDALFLRVAVSLEDPVDGARGLSEIGMKRLRFSDHPIGSKEYKVRKKAFMELLEELQPYKPESTLDGFGPKPEIRSEFAVKIGTERLLKIGEKIVKGLEYELFGRLVRPPRRVEIYPVYINDRLTPYYEKWQELLDPVKKVMNLGPAFKVEFGTDPCNAETSLFRMRIWDHITIWGWCINRTRIVRTSRNPVHQ